MKEIPILFSTSMVQAILADMKTQTRRLLKDKHVLYSLDVNKVIPEYFRDGDGGWCPYGKPGDILWVRETWFPAAINGTEVMVGYHGQDPLHTHEFKTDKIQFYQKQLDKGRMIPSIHMPKEAARIWLQVTDIRVERLQGISEDDAIAEGIESYHMIGDLIAYKNYSETARKDFLNKSSYGFDSGKETHSAPVASFCSLWVDINGRESWISNPWIWVISFKVLSTTGKPDLNNQ